MRPVFTSAGQKCRDRVWVEQELFLLCQAQGATVGSCPRDGGSHLEGQRALWVPGAACGQLVDSSWIGCHQGDILSISTFWSQCLGSAGLPSAASIWRGVCFPKPSSGARARALSASFREPGV